MRMTEALTRRLARRGRTPAEAGTLHVTNGDSTAAGLGRSGLEGAVLAWRDMLPEGPLAAVPAPELRRLRAGYLAGCGWGETRAIAAELEQRDRTLAEALAAGRRVVLWFEQDLLDQLQLLQVLAAIGESDRVELIVVDAVAGRPDFRGLGELEPAELHALWPARVPLTSEAAQLGARAWQAVCAPAPTAPAGLIAGDTGALPLLAAAVARWLQELPDTEAGLALSERRILEALADGPRTPHELFAADLRDERLLLNGDAWFWRRLAELGAGPRRLLAPAGGGELGEAPPAADGPAFGGHPLALTAAGRRVLAGEADRVALLGLDRWLGGTHLTPANAWRRDGGGRLVAP